MTDFWEDYGAWLVDRIRFDRRGYDFLLEELHDSPFEWSIARDENRAGDGLILREEYLDAVFDGKYDFEQGCSVLEMLVGLAIRMENEYIGSPGDPHPEVIFWEMLCNLGLDRQDNRRFSAEKVRHILRVWLLREFDFDGNGSIFPVKNAKSNQRNCEIWSQMMAYLNERYGR